MPIFGVQNFMLSQLESVNYNMEKIQYHLGSANLKKGKSWNLVQVSKLFRLNVWGPQDTCGSDNCFYKNFGALCFYGGGGLSLD